MASYRGWTVTARAPLVFWWVWEYLLRAPTLLNVKKGLGELEAGAPVGEADKVGGGRASRGKWSLCPVSLRLPEMGDDG